jgi:hypothetical protein
MSGTKLRFRQECRSASSDSTDGEAVGDNKQSLQNATGAIITTAPGTAKQLFMIGRSGTGGPAECRIEPFGRYAGGLEHRFEAFAPREREAL